MPFVDHVGVGQNQVELMVAQTIEQVRHALGVQTEAHIPALYQGGNKALNEVTGHGG